MADFTVEQLEQMEQSIDRERKGIIATADFVEPEELHREASLCAQANDMTLNSYVEQAIRRSVAQEDLVDKVLKTAVIAVATTQANQNLFSSQYQPSPTTQVYDTTAKIDHIWSLTESHSVHTTRGVSQNA